MTLKERFEEQNKKFKARPNKYSLHRLKKQSPDVYSAHDMMANESGKRCDDFVLCSCSPTVTGIYVVEIKSSNPSASDVKEQLQKGADFVARFLQKNDKFYFSPVLVAKSMPGSMRRAFRKVRIQLSGQGRYVKHVRTNAPLEKLSP